MSDTGLSGFEQRGREIERLRGAINLDREAHEAHTQEMQDQIDQLHNALIERNRDVDRIRAQFERQVEIGEQQDASISDFVFKRLESLREIERLRAVIVAAQMVDRALTSIDEYPMELVDPANALCDALAAWEASQALSVEIKLDPEPS